MPSVDASTFTRVRVIAPRTRVDVALPSDVSLADLLPVMLELVGERADGDGAGWALSGVSGEALRLDATLASLAVLDGAALRLTPGLEIPEPPIYDDVVDAVAATVEAKLNKRDPAALLSACIAAAALIASASALAILGGLIAGITGCVAAVLALAISAQCAHLGRLHLLAATVGIGASALAFVGTANLISGPWDYARVLAGLTAAFVVSLGARFATGLNISAFTATQLITAAWALGALAGALRGYELAHVGAAIAGACLALLALTPWLAVRLARLPMPVVPESATDLQRFDPRNEVAEASRKGSAGMTYLHGLVIGCALGVMSGVVPLLLHPDAWAAAFAIVVIAALLLRLRHIPDFGTRTVATIAMCLTMVVGSVAAIRGSYLTLSWVIIGLLLLIGLGGASAAALTQGRRISPMTTRLIDLSEAVATVLTLPLACAAMGLYGYVRGL